MKRLLTCSLVTDGVLKVDLEENEPAFKKTSISKTFVKYRRKSTMREEERKETFAIVKP